MEHNLSLHERNECPIFGFLFEQCEMKVLFPVPVTPIRAMYTGLRTSVEALTLGATLVGSEVFAASEI